MAETKSRKEELVTRFPRTIYVNPFLPVEVATYFTLRGELERVKQRLMELENREKVIVLKELTREEAKEEIRELFLTGRTLYYSDVVRELGIDLEMVVNIFEELEKEQEIGVDADAVNG